MKQLKTLVMTLFLILTVTVTCGAVEPTNPHSKMNSTPVSERTTILGVESAHESEETTISDEEQIPQEQTFEEDESKAVIEPEVVELDKEKTSSAEQVPPIPNGDFADDEGQTESSKTETESELLEDQDNVKDSGHTDPIQSEDPSVDVGPSQVDNQVDPINQKVFQDPNKTDPVSENVDATNDPKENSQENLNPHTQIEINPQTPDAESNKANDQFPEDETDIVEQKFSIQDEVTIENQASDQEIDSETNSTNELSTNQNAKITSEDQFSQKDSFLAKAIFLFKEFGLWMNNMIISLF